MRLIECKPVAGDSCSTAAATPLIAAAASGSSLGDLGVAQRQHDGPHRYRQLCQYRLQASAAGFQSEDVSEGQALGGGLACTRLGGRGRRPRGGGRRGGTHAHDWRRPAGRMQPGRRGFDALRPAEPQLQRQQDSPRESPRSCRDASIDSYSRRRAASAPAAFAAPAPPPPAASLRPASSAAPWLLGSTPAASSVATQPWEALAGPCLRLSCSEG